VPTLAESFPGLEVFTWVGMWAPAGTPEAVVKRLHGVLGTINADPDIVKALGDAGVEPLTTSLPQMAATVDRETQSMGRLIRDKQIAIN
jgi:tripartite-type tricarboxylate transporter receptor subunit TctC